MTNEVATIQERIAQQLAKQQEAATKLNGKCSYITFKNAQMKIDGTPVPNNQVDARVLATVQERTYYAGEYDADAVQVPACYALNSDRPHPEARERQSDTCATCPQNQWGTGPRGRGKACREGARVIVVPASAPLASAPMYSAKIPVTSLPAVSGFVNRCAQAGKLSGEFVTQLSCVEDKKTFFKVHLNIKEFTQDMDLGALCARQDEALELATAPYPSLEQ